ncbi:hypothetical protein ACIQUM_21245 [Amycolatopsis azurea]|uniref:hypothetical protein n=1 Tax=Amycolatopsis azurea TaxID=36819 RepID=UPI003821A90A
MSDAPAGNGSRPPSDNNTKRTAEILALITASLTILAWLGIANGKELVDWLDKDRPAPSSSARPTEPPVISRSSSPVQKTSKQDETTSETTPTTTATPTTKSPEPPASVGDCVVVDSGGRFVAIGNCDGSRGTYQVNSVRYQGSCVDTESPSIVKDGYRLCLEIHLVRERCYVIPARGWITGAPRCREPGTISVVDIVAGAANDSACTRRYQWNKWYSFDHPQVVYCVMRY